MAADRDQENGTGEPGQREICSFQIGLGAGQQCTQAAYMHGLCDVHYFRGYQMDDDEKEDSVLRNVPRNEPAPAGPMPVLFSASPTKMTAAAPQPEKKVAAVMKKIAPAPAGQAKKGKGCKITGCSKYPLVKGHCLSHAHEHVTKEEMDKFKENTVKICKIADCWKHTVVKPYCLSHANDHVEKEEVDNHMERARARPRLLCKIEGCSKRSVLNRYCLNHACDHVEKEDVDNYKERKSASRLCKITDCSKYTQLKGYCFSHAPKHVKKEDMDNYMERRRATNQKAYIEKKKKKKGGR